MPSDLQNELAIPPFMDEAAGRRPFDGQAAKNEWPGGKSEVLPGCFAIQPDTLDRLDLAHSPFRNDLVGVKVRQQRSDPLQTSGCTILVFGD